MLARIGQPFDSDQHLYEVKWDGVRALAYVEHDRCRLHSRHRRDLLQRYPELESLAALPAGCLLDGELVVLQPDGRADFRGALARENARSPAKVAQAARTYPVTYVVFDLLYERFEPLLDLALAERRARLQVLLQSTAPAHLLLSEGIVGQGLQFFAAIRAQQVEGMMCKRLDSRYRPGERSDAWLKVKAQQRVHCVILGFEPDGERDFKSLIIASDFDGDLRCVGKVGTGFTAAMRSRLQQLLLQRLAEAPLLDPGIPGRWLQPGLYCTVGYLERTANGSLRAPVFLDLIEP